MKRTALVLLAACSGNGKSATPDATSGPPDAPADAAVDAPPPEPMPVFTVSPYVSGQLAVDDTTLRTSFILDGQNVPSFLALSLTQQGSTTSCAFYIAPKFVQFDSVSTSTRHMKTVQYDVATSTVLLDQCHWDDAYVLSTVKAAWGLAEVGFAQARFAEDRPHLDVIIDAEKAFGDTDNITLVAGGAGFAMAADGTVDGNTVVEPAQGTLIRAMYQF